jgi:hypothetical protein
MVLALAFAMSMASQASKPELKHGSTRPLIANSLSVPLSSSDRKLLEMALSKVAEELCDGTRACSILLSDEFFENCDSFELPDQAGLEQGRGARRLDRRLIEALKSSVARTPERGGPPAVGDARFRLVTTRRADTYREIEKQVADTKATGWVAVSLPGFNRAADVAVVLYSSHGNHRDNARGIVFRKDRGSWFFEGFTEHCIVF